jgi:hypothetical protein
MSRTGFQFDNEVTLNDHAIPFSIRKIDGKDYYYVYSYGNNRFQCERLKKAMSATDSELMYFVSQRNKKHKAYYAKFMGTLKIEETMYFYMKIFFDNNDEKEWANWLIPKKYTQRINIITHDGDYY